MKEFAKDILAMEQKLAAKEIQPESARETAKLMEEQEEVKVGGLFSAKASAPSGKPQAASSKP
jgi:hypothetical protein